MLGAEGATRQAVSAPPPSCGSDRTTQTRASAPPQRNRRLREGQRAFLSSPDLGMSTNPASAARIRSAGRKKIQVRAAMVGAGIVRMQLAACIHQQAPGDSELWVLLTSPVVNSSEASPRSQFARLRSSALRASWGSAPDFVVPTTRDSATGGHSGGARPVAARNGAPIGRNAVRGRASFGGV